MPSNALELAGLAARAAILPINIYKVNPTDNYTPVHPNALSDGDIKGKGTGVFLDTYNGGGDIDINGNPIYAGSGRLQQIAVNIYDAINFYDHPDTSGNIGQVVI